MFSPSHQPSAAFNDHSSTLFRLPSLHHQRYLTFASSR
uniref:Uncharacterized protein n=1 Tax=Pristionchus pacificus TaxID=54126 RepID=A0A2A6B2R0_PRIPA|eukprot:PDM60167.1 hypothetical protein PRIPAC_53992 [Pristionchus pacificus]